LGPMPAAVRTILRKFLKFCPYIRAKFSKIFIRPCHLYSGVLGPRIPNEEVFTNDFDENVQQR
jgi:hypothetical protein